MMVRRAVGALAVVEHLDDVRALELVGRQRLLEEARHHARVGVGVEQLDRHPPAEPTVAGLVDRAHAALADASLDHVVPDRSADPVAFADRHAERVFQLIPTGKRRAMG
jgi:hypothetical protein